MMPANPGASASPVPVIVHIACAVSYAVLGAFQLSAGLRRRRHGLHRVAGRALGTDRPSRATAKTAPA